ncbi:MAG: hypothetical protein B7Z72_00930 [Gemmatimonadetes bacterium 21-71-4]|nr:MAG: hypothetical protein B7Z72_00930 [Gemmatimonadetes bacterium 21-71-4]
MAVAATIDLWFTEAPELALSHLTLAPPSPRRAGLALSGDVSGRQRVRTVHAMLSSRYGHVLECKFTTDLPAS